MLSASGSTPSRTTSNHRKRHGPNGLRCRCSERDAGLGGPGRLLDHAEHARADSGFTLMGSGTRLSCRSGRSATSRSAHHARLTAGSPWWDGIAGARQSSWSQRVSPSDFARRSAPLDGGQPALRYRDRRRLSTHDPVGCVKAFMQLVGTREPGHQGGRVGSPGLAEPRRLDDRFQGVGALMAASGPSCQR
jgi:hypothetical protein